MDKGSFGRKDRLVKEREHDVYHSRTKQQDPAQCADCGVAYIKGRWVWRVPPQNARITTCPACRRVADRFPAGHVELQGRFFEMHHDEILNLVYNVERKEKANHSMERIMGIEDRNGCAKVTTTGIHVARGIGAALERAYRGNLSMRYLDADNCIRVNWSR